MTEGADVAIVRAGERPTVDRGPDLPTLQQLLDRANGSNAVTVLVNQFTNAETVPLHVHDVEEVLLVVAGECTVTVDGHEVVARSGDAVVVEPGLGHSITHRPPRPCTVIAVLASPDLHIGPTASP